MNGATADPPGSKKALEAAASRRLLEENSSNGGGNDPSENNSNSNNNEVHPLMMTTDAGTTQTSRRRVLGMQGVPEIGSRFGGLAASVEASVSASIDKHLGSLTAPFAVTPVQLGHVSSERTRTALAELLELGVLSMSSTAGTGTTGGTGTSTGMEVVELTDGSDVETPNAKRTLETDVQKLVAQMRAADAGHQHQVEMDKMSDAAVGAVEQKTEKVSSSWHGNGKAPKLTPEAALEADKNADMAANVLVSVLLRSSPESGIDPREVEHRRKVFGSNAIAEKPTDSFLKLCWEAVQDFVLIMLIVLGITGITVEVTTHEGPCNTCWIEGAAILVSVVIVVCVTAGIDYMKQFAFLRLTRSLHDTNTKQVIRDGKQVSVTDDDIVVGDILSVNSHNLASIPADCVLIGPPADLKMNESSLTGESKLISKKPGDIILSGTNAVQGSGRMVVIAVGVNSVAGKIKAQVYESADHQSDLESDDDDNSPLFVKLDLIARRIGMAGTVAALLAFTVSCIIGFGIEGDDVNELVDYLVTAITVLAVAVPEGLPLAVTLALAFSSNKMMKEQNLVKHLDACETMGCATTICTDKTGTLLLSLLLLLLCQCWGGSVFFCSADNS